MGQTITFSKGGYVHAETADRDMSAIVREILANARDKFPGAELVGEPRIELSQDVENIPEEYEQADGEWSTRPRHYRTYQVQVDVQQP